MPVYSMTGFATVQGRADDGTGGGAAFTLTLKSVNHRFLDLSLRLPPGCDALEIELRRVLKAALVRGHVDVTLQVLRGESTARLELNEGLLAGHVAALRRAAELCGIAAEPDLNALLRQPGVLRAEMSAAVEDPAKFHEAVLAVLPELLASLQRARGEEGATLAAELRSSMRRLERFAAEVRALRACVREAWVERLRSRMAEMLREAVPEERLLAEAALLAERSDVDEELVRLETHAGRFLALLDEGGELGKRLDFLLQELNREANTLLSKTGGAAAGEGLRITELGLEMKLEIERAREQVQNLE